MTPALLRQAGLALYGRSWQRELARALNVNERTVRRWLSGENEMQSWLPRELAALLEQRAADARALAAKLRTGANAGRD